jgi:hypothetical protein
MRRRPSPTDRPLFSSRSFHISLIFVKDRNIFEGWRGCRLERRAIAARRIILLQPRKIATTLDRVLHHNETVR